MSTQPRPSVAAEAALVLVHLVVAVSFARLFVGNSFVRPLVAYVVLAEVLAIGTRRLRVPTALVLAIAIIGAVVVSAWILFGDTLTWGLPSAGTWDAARLAADEARARYPEVTAPTEAIDGFLLVSGLALWTACWFADWTAHRLGASAEAVAPAAAVFIFGAILGSEQYEVISAVAFCASALLFIALQRSDRLARDQAWSPDARPAARSMLRGAAAIGAIAVIAGAIIGPELPGASAESLVDWRGGAPGSGSRVTVSPMVELNKRLVEQSDVEVFTVRSSQRSYWRLTSLDRFDGEIWSSNGEFRPAGDDLPTASPMVQAGEPTTQEIEIEALAAIWAPAAFEAVSVRSSDADLRWDPDSSTLIVDAGRSTSDGLTYTVVSQAPTYDAAVLASSGRDDPERIEERYESLPDEFPSSVTETARQVTQTTETRYDQALALQNWFRENFEYSLDSPAGHGDDALEDFLASRVGYCEQFSGAYAAMARSLGIPSRVAVGFTPGESDPDQPDVYHVRGRHAHAWPELYFPGIGWVPFEPTPGRGIPGGQGHTGVREQQDERVGGGIGVPTTVASTTAPDRPTTSASSATTAVPRTETEAGAPDDSDTGSSGTDHRPLVAAALVALGLGALAWWRRRRREHVRRARLRPLDQAWEDVVARLRDVHQIVVEPAETPAELARRVGVDHPSLRDDLLALAELVTADRWSPGDGIGEAASREAQLRRDAVMATLASRSNRELTRA